MRNIIAIDPGLNYCGLAAVRTNGVAHELVALSVCVTEKASEPRPKPMLRDDRVHRARCIRRWLSNALRLYMPAALVIEDFGFLQQAYSTACLAMAYQACIDAIDEWWEDYGQGYLPLVSANANEWRGELAGLAMPRQRTSTKGLSKSEALKAKADDRAVNRKITAEREKRAHAEALRRVKGAQQEIDMMTATRAVHTLDALGLFCWGVTTAPVKGAIHG